MVEKEKILTCAAGCGGILLQVLELLQDPLGSHRRRLENCAPATDSNPNKTKYTHAHTTEYSIKKKKQGEDEEARTGYAGFAGRWVDLTMTWLRGIDKEFLARRGNTQGRRGQSGEEDGEREERT